MFTSRFCCSILEFANREPCIFPGTLPLIIAAPCHTEGQFIGLTDPEAMQEIVSGSHLRIRCWHLSAILKSKFHFGDS